MRTSLVTDVTIVSRGRDTIGAVEPVATRAEQLHLMYILMAKFNIAYISA
jgi:hypothetical protein